MERELDAALQRLSGELKHAGLAELEHGVFERLHQTPNSETVPHIRIGVLATLGALALGVVGGAPWESATAQPTLSPFGPNSALAPSTLLAGNE